LLERLGVAKEHLLHAAESLYHDVAPARELGIATVWVNRRQGRAAAASRLANVKPDFEVANIQQLARLALSRSATGSRES
jgi:2-haloacid dehalogenase